jgi:predicted ABC-type transport system involved in lysophospholipase L1 biosynthesis ATPase subunit
MNQLYETGRTLVLITHDVGVASAAGRVIGIRDGLVTENGERNFENVR